MKDKWIGFESLRQSWVFLLARACLALFFFWSGYFRLLHWDSVLEYTESFSLPFPGLILAVSSGIEVLGGLAILLGRFTREAALLLMIYTLIFMLVFNRFWTFPEQEQFLQTVIFMKRLGVIGALEILRVCGPGRIVLKF